MDVCGAAAGIAAEWRNFMGNFFTDVLAAKDPALAASLEEMSQLLSLKKGDVLIHMGEVPENIYFLKSGLVVGYYFDQGGSEVTDCIVNQPGHILMHSFTLEEQSKIIVQALRPTEVVSLPQKPALELILNHPEGLERYQALITDAAEECWKRQMLFSTSTARQKYEWFLKTYPDIADVVSDRRIASFLAINPVTLSRVRRDMRQEAQAGEGAACAQADDTTGVLQTMPQAADNAGV